MTPSSSAPASMTNDEILDRMSRHAVRKAHTLLPAQEVEDAVQTAMLQVWRRLPKLDPEREPWPLLTMVVRQELAMYARAFYDRREFASERHRDATLSDVEAPPVYVDERGIGARLEAVLDDLPARWREAMVECVAEGRTKQQAAAIMGVSDVRVGQLVRLGTSRMRERMAA